MKTKEEIKQQASEHFRQAHPQLIYTNTQVDWMLQQYSDQNTNPLVDSLNKIIHVAETDDKNMIINIYKAISEAKELLSQYDKENNCV